MITARTLAIVALGLVFSAHSLQGQGPPQYRNFQLGADVASVSALAGVPASQARTIRVRPVVLQELEWRPPYSAADSTAARDPVQGIVFSFYNDQLSRMVISYDRRRTEGMTDGDVVDALSKAYGSPLLPRLERTPAVASTLDTQSGTPVAQWGDTDYSVVLYRSTYASVFRLIVTSSRLDALARTADAQAVRLDEFEAPQREAARQEKEAEDARMTEETARVANKSAFRP
jgi:hypothetical protein